MITTFIPGFDGLKLKANIVDRKALQWVIITHGVGEHSGRHKYWLREEFKGLNILFYDLRGHGGSEGERGFIQKFDDYTKDIDSIISFLQKEYSMREFILFGHSMGGLITARWIVKHPNAHFYPKKIILSAPAAGAAGILGDITHSIPSGIYDQLMKLPTFKLGGVLDLKKLSHNPQVHKDYISDPLNLLRVHTHLYFDLLKMAKETFSKTLGAKCPLLVIIGSEDVLVNRALVIKHFSMIDTNAQLEVIPGGYHELYMETDEYFLPFIEKLKKITAQA